MSEFSFDDERALEVAPAVLEGGRRVVRLPEGMTVDGWTSTRWGGVKPTLSRLPRRGESVWPGWPRFSERSLERVIEIVESQCDGGKGLPLGYMGPEERALERRYADMVGPDDMGRQPMVFAVRDGSLALVIAYVAILTKRYEVDSREITEVPTALTAARSFGATYTSLQRAGVKPVFLDVDFTTGCVAAEALDEAYDHSTALFAVPLLHDRSPYLEHCRQVADRRGVALLLDVGHAHMATWNNAHVAKLADIMIVSSHGSEIFTPGAEYGFIVVFDPTLAELVAKIRDVGRGLEAKPSWWPANLPVAAGENDGIGELNAVLVGGSFDSYEELQPNRVDALQGLQSGLASSRGPWRMLPPQPKLSGMDTATLVWDPDKSDRPDAWRRIGWAKSGQLLAKELVTEIGASELRPWTGSELIPNMNPDRFRFASYLADHVHLASPMFLARDEAARQLLTAAEKLARWVPSSWIQDWAWRTT